MNYDNEIKRISKIYDDRARKSNSIDAAGQWGTKDLAQKVIQKIIEKIDLNKKDVILEIGCGSGVLGSMLSKNSQMFIGFDVSKLMLKKFHDEHKNVNLIQASATHIPLRNDYFDKVIMNGVSMYFPNDEFLYNVLDEIKRISKKKYLIFIGESILESKYYWELVWFENLSIIGQFMAKPYIKFRRKLAKKGIRFSGKWKNAHKDISKKRIQKYFKNSEIITISDSASYTIRKKLFGEKVKGNKRVDIIIKMK